MIDLVSVIIPIYNVEKYLKRCIDSILNQSYKNLEIILVDDGSPDKCGQICDFYKNQDSRIIVIHQKNKGLSGARNAGIDIAKGRFITFVDSDDWLSEDFIENGINEIHLNDADVFVTSFMQVYDDGKQIKNSKFNDKMIFTKLDALSSYQFNDYLTTCICGKLWKTSLWNEIRHPEGRLFEDQFTIYKILERADKIVFDPLPRYFYYKREGSIGHSCFSKRTFDLYYAANEANSYLATKYPSITKNLAVGRIFWEVVFVNMMLNSNYLDNEVIKQIRSYTKKNTFNIVFSNKINIVRKFQFILFAFCMPIYKLLYKKYKTSKKLG